MFKGVVMVGEAKVVGIDGCHLAEEDYVVGERLLHGIIVLPDEGEKVGTLCAEGVPHLCGVYAHGRLCLLAEHLLVGGWGFCAR